MSQQKVTALCLLDLSGAFDTIDRSILLHRLSSWFGLSGKALSWLSSYLASRSFVVNINSSVSDQFPLTQGVPQGSVLGPLLFILYTTPSALLSLTHYAVIIFMLMTLHYSFPSRILISLPTSYTNKRQLTLSPSGCLQISFHLIKLRLSFSSLAYLLSSLK
jgi:Reverse transcriptase (RNA-dependent DNA polymerase)